MKAQVITLDAKKAGDIDLDDGIFVYRSVVIFSNAL